MAIKVSRYGRVSVLLGLLLFTTCGTRRNHSEEDLIADSAIVLQEFPTYSDFESIDLAIVCVEGKISGVLAARPIGRPLLTTELKISTENFLKLWRGLEANGIWDLPTGEFWPVRELLEAGRFPAGLPDQTRDETEDYKTIRLDASLYKVEVRVNEISHGFLRYSPSDLKDPRYYRVVEVIWDAAPQAEEFLMDWYRQQSGQH